MCGDTIKTIVLPFEININGAESSATLSLPPLPVGVDEIAIQQVNAFSAAAIVPDNLYFIWTDLTGANMCSFIYGGQPASIDCNIIIPVAPRPLPSTVTFQIREFTPQHTFIATTQEFLISITLAFRKKCNHQ